MFHKSPVTTLAPKAKPITDSKFNGFQIPIRAGYNNSGGYDPTGKGSVGHVHQGIDLRAPGGTTLYPMAPGVVSSVRSDPKGGNTVNIKYDNGYASYYAHMATIAVHANDRVDYNTVVGTVGDSGNAKGFPHLHLQCYKNGSLIDPASILNLPKYIAFDNKKEKLWLPNAKEVAQNWNLKDHVNKKLAYKVERLVAIAEEFSQKIKY